MNPVGGEFVVWRYPCAPQIIGPPLLPPCPFVKLKPNLVAPPEPRSPGRVVPSPDRLAKPGKSEHLWVETVALAQLK